MARSINLDTAETKIYESNTERGLLFRRAIRAKAQALAFDSGQTVEIFAAEGYVLETYPDRLSENWLLNDEIELGGA